VKRRLAALALAFVAAFGVLLARLAQLQLVLGERYARAAGETRRRVEHLGAPRGPILDRRGRVLAEDVPAYRLSAILAELDPSETIPARVARIIRKPRADMELRWRETARLAALHGGVERDLPPLPVALAPSPDSEKAFRRLAAGAPFEGLSVEGRALLASTALLLQRERTLARLARLSGLDPAAAERRLAAASARAAAARDAGQRADRLDDPVVLASGVPFDVIAEVEEEARLFPGIVVDVVQARRNPCGEVAGHVLGSVGAARPRAVEAFGVAGSIEERAGVDGVEASRNLVLAGVPGARLVEWNRVSREVTVVAEEPPTPGAAVRLTIDIELQRAVEAALDEAVRLHAARGKGGGAAVLLDARTGEVLAIASAPRYDPSRLSRDFAEVAALRPSPLVHRAIAAELPPGSIMKLLTSAAALETGAITADSTIFCQGYLHTRRAFKCNGYHAEIGLRGAIARSCNVFYYKAGEALGEGPLTGWARAFGFGARAGIDLPGERRGLVPSGAWKRARHEAQRRRVEAGRGAVERAAHEAALLALVPGPASLLALAQAERALADREARLATATAYLARTADDRAWTAGDDRNTAIGQGSMLVTPLQMARLAAAVASKGKLFRPRIFLGAESRTGGAGTGTGTGTGTEVLEDTGADPDAATRDPLSPGYDPFAADDVAEMAVSPAHWAAIQAGMVDCVSASYGTAHKSGLAAHRAAAKTGTAEAPGGSHAWIAGYAPADAPEVAFAVVIEHVADGVHGGDVAGPAAARMLAALAAAKAGALGAPGTEGRP
jgi:penicillin-binding protein 2